MHGKGLYKWPDGGEYYENIGIILKKVLEDLSGSMEKSSKANLKEVNLLGLDNLN